MTMEKEFYFLIYTIGLICISSVFHLQKKQLLFSVFPALPSFKLKNSRCQQTIECAPIKFLHKEI